MKINQNTAILFWLCKAKQSEDGKIPIYCRITVEGKRAEFSTGKKIKADNWSSKSGEAKGFSEEAVTINRELRKIKAGLQKTYDQLDATHERVTAEMLKNTYLGIGPRNKTINEVFAEYNKILKERAEAKEPTLKVKTWQRFEITKQKVIDFLKHKYSNSQKLISEIKNTFGDDFKHYLTTVDNIGMNTAMKYLKNTKQVFHYAVLQEYIPTSPMAAFKCSYKNPKRERLTWQELVGLYETPMTVARLEEVRDVYVFSCFTGYAYIDVYKLTPENVVPWIDGSKWMIRDRYKNDNKSNVPLMEIPLAIIEKYRSHPYCQAYNKLLPVNSNQRYNAYLKEIAAIAGINKNLTTHTARHTFATTVLLENDCPIESASEMLGHNSIRTTQIYAKTTDVKVSRNMKEVRAKITGKLQIGKTGS
ncbi:site-specific integrase [Chitinophagaceae bacterium LB-8]|uniref:Site-specific integrase n=1 Tax=Paraflavisolibacter caeni TaxID=2982496 RepID=A0A9X2XVH3_9BACT|nr:site-specific integrase [Paraflavisolibacter caeni]MCU7549331.1 site-specific integrase [Paraflavisolibacter caeni]